MKEHPIIFSAPMVRAILDGRKTQTRRPINRLRNFGKISEFGLSTTTSYDWHFRDKRAVWNDIRDARLWECCPYGAPGDRLWVRETCRAVEIEDGTDCVEYLADNAVVPIENNRDAADKWLVLYTYRGKRGCSVPSIFMPRWASRITLKITSVRVQRLQDISCADAIAEGIRPAANSMTIDCDTADPRKEFSRLWNSINGPDSWDQNPWVWALTFRVVDD